MLKLWRNETPLSLGGKILIGNITMMGLVLVLLLGYMLIAYLDAHRQQMMERSQTLVLVSTAAISASVIQHDLLVMEAFASILLESDDILFVRILDAQGEILVSEDKNDLLKQAFVSDDNSVGTHNDGVFDVGSDIIVGDELYGRLEIGIDARELLEEAFILVYEMIIGGLIGIVLISLLNRWYLNHLMQQLISLKDTLFGLVQGKGDFNVSLPVEGADEVSQVALYFNQFVKKLHDMVVQILYVSQGLSDSSIKAQEITTSTSTAITDQAYAIAGFTQNIDQLAKTSGHVSNEVGNVAQQAKEIQQQATAGRQVVETAVSSMDQLKNNVAETKITVSELADNNANISKVLDMIVSIAEQTNLLALNAAIEAARAGEHGRGFAVVADEVRNLSQRTTDATGEIRSLIETIQMDSDKAVASMDQNENQADQSQQQIRQAGNSFTSIANAIADIHSSSASSADLANQQHQMAEGIRKAIMDIEKSVQEVAAMAKQNISDNSDLSQYSVQLETLVGGFSGKQKVQKASEEEAVELF